MSDIFDVVVQLPCDSCGYLNERKFGSDKLKDLLSFVDSMCYSCDECGEATYVTVNTDKVEPDFEC